MFVDLRPGDQEGLLAGLVQDAAFNGQSLVQTPQDIIDGTTLIIFSDAAAQANHDQINGATNNPTTAGWFLTRPPRAPTISRSSLDASLSPWSTLFWSLSNHQYERSNVISTTVCKAKVV